MLEGTTAKLCPEKLTAFHLQPFRGRKAANQEEAISKKRTADEPWSRIPQHPSHPQKIPC